MEEVIVYTDCLSIDNSGDFVRCSLLLKNNIKR